MRVKKTALFMILLIAVVTIASCIGPSEPTTTVDTTTTEMDAELYDIYYLDEELDTADLDALELDLDFEI